MRAVVYAETGSPDVLQIIERPARHPAAGEVSVRVHRSGVNPTDWKARTGAAAGIAVTPPQVPNQDGAGIVEAIGTGVDHALLGQRVWLWEAAHHGPDGSAQEQTIISAERVVPLPDSASFDLGASLGVPFVTAHRCLTVAEDGPDRLGPGALSGRVVLVAGGAGAVGNAAIQLARWADATVITTVSSPAKSHLAARAGADHVIDYRSQDVAAEIAKIAPGGVNNIVEVSATNAALDAQIIARHGAVAVYAGTPGQQLTLPVRELMMPNARWQFVLIYTAPDRAKSIAIDDVASAVLAGAVHVGDEAGLPLHHYALERAADAHAAVENAIVGKVLIDIV